VEQSKTIDTSGQQTSFESLGISPATRAALGEMGYQKPTQVQQETVPRAAAGHDLVVMSRTGTGKTAAFGIAIAERLDASQARVQALVLTPTRELASQVTEELEGIGRGRGLRAHAVYGGESIGGQIDAIRGGVHVVVGTPGRVLDHLKRRTLVLTAVKILVLDEADKMLDMGFAQEMGEIMQFMPEERQTLLFSATIPLGIRGLIYNYLTEPEWVLLSEDFAYVKEVSHSYIIAPHMHKEQVLYKLIEHDHPSSSIIFCNTRGEVRIVAGFLARQGLPVAMISSDLVQKKREQVMANFRAGTIRHLVATDVAARGIDIEDLSHVFIYSTPQSPEVYIHRAGRTGRIGKSGQVVSLVSAADLVSFNRLVNRYHLEIRERDVPSDAEIEREKAERILRRLAEEARTMSREELADLEKTAEALATHPDRSLILAYLIRRDFGDPVDVEAQEAPAAVPTGDDGPPPSAEGGKRRRRRRGRSRSGEHAPAGE
jgi:ATP-dependent RNA helicase DeaD